MNSPAFKQNVCIAKMLIKMLIRERRNSGDEEIVKLLLLLTLMINESDR